MIQQYLIRNALALVTVFICANGCHKHHHTNHPAADVKIPGTKHEIVNLAVNKIATASSTEYDEHSASKAVDGSVEENSRWCAADGEVPQWLKVDLGKPATIKSAEITWEFDGKLYLYSVEGSIDDQKWVTLADRSTPTLQKSFGQKQNLEFPETPGVRYVRVRVTSLEDGAWASICEIKVMGY